MGVRSFEHRRMDENFKSNGHSENPTTSPHIQMVLLFFIPLHILWWFFYFESIFKAIEENKGKIKHCQKWQRLHLFFLPPHNISWIFADRIFRKLHRIWPRCTLQGTFVQTTVTTNASDCHLSKRQCCRAAKAILSTLVLKHRSPNSSLILFLGMNCSSFSSLSMKRYGQ